MVIVRFNMKTRTLRQTPDSIVLSALQRAEEWLSTALANEPEDYDNIGLKNDILAIRKAIVVAKKRVSIEVAIADVESSHFRTVHDSGAHSLARMIHNCYRGHAGLEPISNDDLPTWDAVEKVYRRPADSKLLK